MPVGKAERRFCGLGVRVDRRADAPTKIAGYGAVFYRIGDPGTEYELWTDTYERILPGAFGDVSKLDVRSLFNHDPNWVLGRTKSTPATLVLSVDSVGLQYATLPPDTQSVRDQVLGPLERGDVDGSSFMFWTKRASWTREVRDGRDIEVRLLEEVELVEVGPVTFPAYEGTTSGLRSACGLDDVRAEHEASRARARRASDALAAWVAVRKKLRRVA